MGKANSVEFQVTVSFCWKWESYAWYLMPVTLALKRLRLGTAMSWRLACLMGWNPKQEWDIQWDPEEDERRGERRKKSCYVSSSGTPNTLNSSECTLLSWGRSLILNMYTQQSTATPSGSCVILTPVLQNLIPSSSLFGHLHIPQV